MLSMELIKGTRVYQELKEEARQEVKQEVKEEVKQEVKEQFKQEVKVEVQLEMIAKLLQRGMSVQEVAEILELNVDFIRRIVDEQS